MSIICGLICFNDKYEIYLFHPICTFGRKDLWTITKDKLKENETDLQCALRSYAEATNDTIGFDKEYVDLGNIALLDTVYHIFAVNHSPVISRNENFGCFDAHMWFSFKEARQHLIVTLSEFVEMLEIKLKGNINE